MRKQKPKEDEAATVKRKKKIKKLEGKAEKNVTRERREMR